MLDSRWGGAPYWGQVGRKNQVVNKILSTLWISLI